MLLPTSVVVWLGWISIASLLETVSLFRPKISFPVSSAESRGVVSALLGVGSDIFLASVLLSMLVLLPWSRSFVFP